MSERRLDFTWPSSIHSNLKHIVNGGTAPSYQHSPLSLEKKELPKIPKEHPKDRQGSRIISDSIKVRPLGPLSSVSGSQWTRRGFGTWNGGDPLLTNQIPQTAEPPTRTRHRPLSALLGAAKRSANVSDAWLVRGILNFVPRSFLR